MKVHEFLTEATWCRGAFARNKAGDPVHADDASACSWCILGAIFKVYGTEVHKSKGSWPSIERLDALVKTMPGNHATVAGWQDDPDITWEDVHNLLVTQNV